MTTPIQPHGRTTNFLRHHSRKRKLRWILGIGGPIFVLVVLLGVLYQEPALALYRHAQEGRNRFEQAKVAVEQQRFTDASDKVQGAIEAFEAGASDIKRLNGLRVFPGMGRQLSAVENLLRVGSETGKAVLVLSTVAERVTQPIQKENAVSFASITREEKRTVLQLVAESEPDIQGAKAQLDLARTYLDQIPDGGLVGPISTAVKTLRDQIPALQSLLEQAIPTARVLPGILGFPEKRQYLFLLENNSELRPTGGFIGTYGILAFQDGEIESFETDNIYNLDEPAKEFLTIEPPEPLQKYLSADRWYLRDANWSPDFPTSAQQALRFYDLETQRKNSLDGVIAVTPTFIQSLLQLTGDIQVNGITFTPDNLVDVLEYQVQLGFYRQGIPESERKEVIGALAQSLFDRLITLPKERWGELWDTLRTNVAERHILVHFTGEDEQQFVSDLDWSGDLHTTDNDYVMVVDANMASLKTDPFVRRTITYHVQPEGEKLIASLSVRYKNEGSFDWKTGRYRTYTRMYVPEGSVLVESSGFLTQDKLHNGKPTNAKTSNELGKTVFEGFISIEPQEEGTVELRYELPESLAKMYNEGRYSVYVQKQPGTLAHELLLDVKTKGPIQSYSPLEGVSSSDSSLEYRGDLRLDRVLSLIFRPS